LKYSPKNSFRKHLALLCLCALGGVAVAQTTYPTGTNGARGATNKDTSKTNTGKWKDEAPNITFEKLNSAHVYVPDTSLHTYHRNLFNQPWSRDLGNLGSPAYNLLFTPENRVGPSLGYHVNDIYRLNVDSLNFMSTARPYSVFSFQLGSKLEQTANIMHTQNIKPNWNFMVDYRKINSQGAYKISRNNDDIFGFTTNYKSLDKHYALYGAMVYNKIQHDENGGIVNDSQLINPIYTDRRTVDVAYQNGRYSTTRSPVSNMQRDFTMMLQQSYSWGKKDTTYNADSTQFTHRLIPRFGITHKMELSTEKHVYNDLRPDSLRYDRWFQNSFANVTDSVLTQQKWFWVDNKVLLNGFIGKEGHQSEFSAGLGNRYDQFVSTPTANEIKDSLPKHYYYSGLDRSSITSNYLVAEIKKEALTPGAWEYGANTRFFLTGQDAGNFQLDAHIGKTPRNGPGRFAAGFSQQVGSAPYSYTNYENLYVKQFFSFSNEGVSMLYASIERPALRLSGGVRNYVVANYIYINDSGKPAQYTIPFSVTQAWVRKVFKVGNFYLDNELVYQQAPANAPINIPAFMGRHQLSYEYAVFKKRLKIATGIEARYNTAYHPAGYSPLLNKFFNQGSTYVSNTPELAAFFNFRIKRFRAFLMGDNLQQLFGRNTVLFTNSPIQNYYGPHTAVTPIYAAPDMTIRFGFTWVMVN
jgi:hypothetical protein